MNSLALVLVALMVNIVLICSMPTWSALSTDYQSDSNDFDPLAKRLTLPQWIHKRNPGLCDYRLQLRPLPLTSALCAYGEFLLLFRTLQDHSRVVLGHMNNDGGNPVQPFKYG